MKQMMIATAVLALTACAAGGQTSDTALTFDASKGVPAQVTLPRGQVVNYTAYMRNYYVANVEDSTYQYLNIYVPEGATQSSPIFMPNSVGGYMAGPPGNIDANGATGRALLEGYVVVMPGARGRNSTSTVEGQTIYNGRAPRGLLDLKAAVRYLRHFDAQIPGNKERIFTNGTSAGGAMSALLGTTGNNPAYEPYLEAMGAANERDDVFASVCFCPIIDLEHADMAYEWLYACTNDSVRNLTDAQREVSAELAALYPDYLASLGLINPADGTPLTIDNYTDYLREYLIASAQEAKDAGADIATNLGFQLGSAQGFQAPLNGGMPQGGPQGAQGPGGQRPDGQGPQGMQGGPQGMQGAPQGGPMGGQGPSGQRPDGQGPQGGPQGMGRPQMGQPGGMMRMGGGRTGETITGLDLTTYLCYVASTTRLKTPPAFDSQGVAEGRSSGENQEFGDDTGSSVNFTDYSLRHATGDVDATIDADLAERVRLLNPMRMAIDPSSTVAAHWYIRHGARDRDTSFPVPINFATRLMNQGRNVNFKLPWNRPHSGDYALNELFAWMNSL